MGGPSSLQSVLPIPGTTYFGIHGSFEEVVLALLYRIENYISLHHFTAETYTVQEGDGYRSLIQAWDNSGDPFYLLYWFKPEDHNLENYFYFLSMLNELFLECGKTY